MGCYLSKYEKIESTNLPIIIMTDLFQKIVIHYNNNHIKLSQKKFMVQKEMTFGYFSEKLKIYISPPLKEHQNTLLLLNGKNIPLPSHLIGQLSRYANNNGELHFDLLIENTFGYRDKLPLLLIGLIDDDKK